MKAMQPMNRARVYARLREYARPRGRAVIAFEVVRERKRIRR